MFDAFAGGGLKFGGWIPGRAEDEFGIAISAAFTSDSWRRATGGGSAEVAIETSYRARLTPWLSIQPSAHYIRRTSADPGIAEALRLGLRFEAAHRSPGFRRTVPGGALPTARAPPRAAAGTSVPRRSNPRCL